MPNVPSALAAKAATKTVPIAFLIGANPVASGLVASLARPGGNITGVTVLTNEVIAKRVEFLRELVPGAKSIACLVNPTNLIAQADLREVSAATLALGLRLSVLNASTEGEIETGFTRLSGQRVDGLVIGGDAFFVSAHDLIVALAARYSIPAIYQDHISTAAGGLMSYGSDFRESYRQLGIYAGRILKGEKPADLPVQQATKVELVINLKTAKALGLNIPPTVLARADEVIE